MIGKIAASLLSATALANPASLGLPPGYTTYDAPASSGGYVAPAPAAPAAPALDPMMMMLLMKDGDSSMSDLLPLLMMSGGAGGAGGLGGMDPMMLMMLMDGDSDMSDLLPLMMMGGGAGGAGGMNPLLMMSLLGDSCKPKGDLFDALESGDTEVDDDLKKELAAGEKFYIGTAPTVNAADLVTSSHAFTTSEATIAQAYLDFDYQKCSAGGSSGLSDLLPLMMMGGGAGAGGMDPMMLMMLMGDGDMSDMLPLLMMGGLGGGAAGGAAPAMDPMMLMMLMGDGDMSDLLPLMMMGGAGGAEGGMNPLLMMTLLDSDSDDDKTAEDCDKKFKLDSTIAVTAASDFTFSAVTDIADIRAVFTSAVNGYPDVSDSDSFAAKYASCLSDPTSYDFGSSGISDLLPLMMMSGGKIDPMMLMLLGDDDSSMSDLLPLMMMSGGLGGAGGAAGAPAMDPMMMMMLLKE